MTDLLDDELSASFDRAHHAQHWAGSTWPDPVDRVRRASARGRARTAVAATAGLALVAGGVVAGVHAVPSRQDRVIIPGSGGDGAAQSGAGGAQWLLAPRDYEAYTAAHPSPSPSVDRVASPAPSNDQLTGLQADIAAAVPAGGQTLRADAADGGVRGTTTVWLRLADGTPVVAERYRIDYPRRLSANDPSATETVAEHFTDPQTWSDGTAYTVVTGSGWGYAFDARTEWNGPFVWTVTPDGWFTTWSAPVPVDRLLGWAEAADAHFAASQ